MVVRIADAGFIVAFANGTPIERAWARAEMKKPGPPFLTCEGALIEASHLCGAPLVARLLHDRQVLVGFNLSEQIRPVMELVEKYRDMEMDLTDACIVRMSELFPDCTIFTVDHDFDVYRRFRNERIPTSYPSR